MLSWALAFFIMATISAVFAFSGVIACTARVATPPAWWRCPDNMVCTPPLASLPNPPPDFVCPDGWVCKMAITCGQVEIFKVLFVVFVVLFLVSLVAGLIRRP